MIQVYAKELSKQVLRLSSGEYIIRPGSVLTIREYNELDITFLNNLGYRVTNLASESTEVKVFKKPKPLPKGVRIVEKQPEVKPSTKLTSSEYKDKLEVQSQGESIEPDEKVLIEKKPNVAPIPEPPIPEPPIPEPPMDFQSGEGEEKKLPFSLKKKKRKRNPIKRTGI